MKRRIGQILVGLDVVIEEVGTDDVTTAASLVKERLEAAWCGFCELWHGDDHTRLIRGREETDPECLPEDWAKDRSPLNWPAWQALSPPVDRLVSCLPTGLALCFRAGGLLARVEGLDHNEPTQEQMPGEPNPIDACQQVLFQLRDAFEVLGDLDVALTMQAGRIGAEVERARQRCARLDREIRRRFLGEDGEESQEMPRPSMEEDTGAQDEGTVATSVTAVGLPHFLLALGARRVPHRQPRRVVVAG